MDLIIKQTKLPLKKILILFFSLVFISAYLYLNNTNKINIKTLDVKEVRFGKMNLTLISSGVLESKTRQWVSSQSSGVVKEVLYEAGAKISKGSTLIQLENPGMFTDLQISKSSLKILKSELVSENYILKNQELDIESNIVKLESDLILSKEKLEAEEKLAKKGILSKINLSHSQSKVKQLLLQLNIAKKRGEYFRGSLVAQLKTKKAKIEDLEYKIKLKQSQYDNLSIKSNIDGVLQQINTEIGKSISYGDEVALVVQEYPLIAKIQINQGSINKIKIGMQVSIIASGHTLIGQVINIAPQVSDGVVEVLATLPKNYPRLLKSQLNVTATIRLSSLNSVLWLPRPKSVIQGNNVFYKVSSDGKTAKKIMVDIGKISTSQVEILSILNAGDKVIVNPDEKWANSINIE